MVFQFSKYIVKKLWYCHKIYIHIFFYTLIFESNEITGAAQSGSRGTIFALSKYKLNTKGINLTTKMRLNITSRYLE